jgi:hypothetical protein
VVLSSGTGKITARASSKLAACGNVPPNASGLM